MSETLIVEYGAGNTHSVRAAFARIGETTRLSADPEEILSAAYVVLPGVGSARAAMTHLNATGAADALRARFAAGRPILGICLGLQLALEISEEDGGVETLALLPGRVVRLTEGRVPRLGWAMVEPWGEAFYFAHSFVAQSPHVSATSDGVTAAVSHGSFTGVQFHPEKSGPTGERWLASCRSLV